MGETSVEKRRQELYALMGDLPDRRRPISAQTLSQEQRDGYVCETLLLDLNGIEPVPAYFVRPAGASGRLPTLVYNHSHGGNYHIGKEELLSGAAYQKQPAYARELTSRGYAALCIDHWAFGERRGRSESEIFKEMLWSGQVMWGMMVYDTLRAADYLVSRDDVDARRLGTLGMSMGSTMAWWAAALDERFKVCVDICCLTDFDSLIDSRGLDGHGIYYYVPRLLKHFSTGEINALIAPRPHLAVAGTYDRLTPTAGLDRVERELSGVYAKLGAAQAWKLLRYAVGHVETADMRREIFSFLQQWL